jgi:hypothetical protein
MFAVTFRCDVYGSNIVSIRPMSGLRALDAARAALGSDIARVEHRREFTQLTFHCELTETQARKAVAHFADNWETVVTVPPRSLNRYVVYGFVRSPAEPTCARISCDIDGNAVVEDWLRAGAPPEWEPCQEETA